MLKKKVDDARRQEKRIFRVIEDNTETSLTKVKKWITQTEAEEIMERTYNSPRPTTRAILHNMEEKGMIQTTTYSGRRFYAPTTLSMSVLLTAIPPILSIIIMLVMIDIYPLITGHARNLGAYVVSSSPVMLAVVWLLLNRKINSDSDTGICLKCGRVIDAGEKYCSECKKSKKKAVVKKKPEERVWYLFNERGTTASAEIWIAGMAMMERNGGYAWKPESRDTESSISVRKRLSNNFINNIRFTLYGSRGYI